MKRFKIFGFCCCNLQLWLIGNWLSLSVINNVKIGAATLEIFSFSGLKGSLAHQGDSLLFEPFLINAVSE